MIAQHYSARDPQGVACPECNWDTPGERIHRAYFVPGLPEFSAKYLPMRQALVAWA